MLMLPSVCHAYWFSTEAIPFLLTGFVVSVTLAAIILCSPWRWMRWGLFTLLFVGLLFELAHMLVYDGDVSSAGYIRSLFMTTPYEAEGALGRVIMQHIAFIVVVALAYILLSVQIFITHPVCRLSKWLLAGAVVLFVLQLCFAPSALINRPPLNTYVQMAEALHQRNERNRMLAQTPPFTYSAYRAQEKNEKEIYLLIIDESLRYDHVSFSKEDYRITMPRMGKLPNLVCFSNYYTTGVFTMYAVPMLITRATPQTFSLNYTEYGVQQAFSEVGFKTIWLTNEAQLVSDGVSDYVANGAEIVRVKKDMDMSSALDSLCRTADKLFVILHLWGNHQFYLNTDAATSRYYPDITTTCDVHGEQMYSNSYDNAILYTDSLLLAVTDVLRTQHCMAQWIFTSDHGEGPIGRNGGAHGYTRPTSGEYHVPLMIWYSDEYAAAFPEKVANMCCHKDSPLCADHMFWSVLDMAQVEIDSTMQQTGMSFFSEPLIPYTRTLLLPDGKGIMLLDSL